MAKRLYVVKIELEYAALAESEDDAREFVRDALRDDCMYEDDADVVEAKVMRYCLPMGWEDNALVYGADGDVTWSDAVAAEKSADGESKRLAEFAARQVSLPVD